MSLDNKDSQNLIISYLYKSRTPEKRNSGILSPVEQEHQSKKANMGEAKMDSTLETQSRWNETKVDNLRSLLIPLMEKVDQLRRQRIVNTQSWRMPSQHKNESCLMNSTK